MQKQQPTWKTETAAEIAILRVRKPSPLQLAEACACRRKVRIRLPLWRRRSCLTKRALIAALRQAEFAEWQATGGDFLRSDRPDRIQS